MMTKNHVALELEERGASMSLALPDRKPVPLPRVLAPLPDRR